MYVEKTDLESYSDYVSSLAQNKSDALISNGRVDHARVIISNLLLHAQKEVRVFSSNLNRDIYAHESTINSLISFLSKPKTMLRIILQDPETIVDLDKWKETHKFVKTCLNYSEQCLIAKASPSDSTIKEHFVIMDNVGYRFCPDKEKPAAIATFNRPAAALNLVNQFNTLHARSTPLLNHVKI